MLEGVRCLGVAVSGGADSVCLLEAMRSLAPCYGVELAVLHLDHGLRGEESRGDAEFVRELACKANLPFHAETAILSRDANLEQEGRRARLEFFARHIAAGAVDRVATGHTLSDQAETVLFRILRGAAGDGLSGIRPVTAEGLVRPMIAVERAEVLRYLTERGLTWREDSTNQSPDFARNRIRHELLPHLARDWNPEIARTLAHMADWAMEEERVQAAEIERLAGDSYQEDGGAILIPAAKLASFPRSIGRRVVRRAIEMVPGNQRRPGFDHVEAVLELAANPEGGQIRLPGLVVERSFNWVRFAISRPPGGWTLPAPIPGSVRVPGGELLISLEMIDKSETSGSSHYVYNSEMGDLHWNALEGAVTTLRSWLPGDSYQPVGASGVSKIKDLFQRARVPIWEREGWPVLEVDSRIAWSRKFGAASWCAARPDSPKVLRIHEVRR